MSHFQTPISKEDINHLCFPLTFIFRVFLPNNYLRNVTLTPQPPREATLPSHPTPNRSTNPCILQFRVSGGGQRVELCDVGGKRDGVGAAVWNAVPPEGGDGLKVILIRFTTQTQEKKKRKTKQLQSNRRFLC